MHHYQLQVSKNGIIFVLLLNFFLDFFSEALASQGIIKTEWDKVDKPWSFSTTFTSTNKEGNDQEEG